MKFDRRQVLTWPSMIMLFLFALLPLVIMLVTSFQSDTTGGFTLENYERFFSSSTYLRLTGKTIVMSLAVTAVSLLIAYPLAYIMAKKLRGLRNIILILVIIPFFTNQLVRVYSWLIFLQDGGIFNNFLSLFGLFEDGLGLLYTQGAVIIGLTHAFFPYMVVTIYMSLERMDDAMLEASRSLGASKFTTFRRIIFPLSMPGVISGIMIVFVPALGTFVEPRILGGTDGTVIGTVIEDQFFEIAAWNFGAAIAFLLLALVLISMTALNMAGKRWEQNEKQHHILSRIFVILVILFLYVPIFVLMLLGFNESRYNSLPFEFTTKWYEEMITNEALLTAAKNSLLLALVTGILCTVLATLFILGQRYLSRKTSGLFNSIVMMPMSIPWLIMGLSILLMIRSLDFTKNMGFVLAGHVIISLPYAFLVLRARMSSLDKSLEEMSASLGAGPLTTFRRVTLPAIAPAMVAGGFLAFMISFDNFAISYFLIPNGVTTLPIEIQTSIKFGFTPEINAISTVIIVFSLVILLIVGIIVRVKLEGNVGRKKVIWQRWN